MKHDPEFTAFKKRMNDGAEKAKQENWIATLKEKKVVLIDAVNDTAAKYIFNLVYDILKATNYTVEFNHPTNLNLIKDWGTKKYFLELEESAFIRTFEKQLLVKALP